MMEILRNKYCLSYALIQDMNFELHLNVCCCFRYKPQSIVSLQSIQSYLEGVDM